MKFAGGNARAQSIREIDSSDYHFPVYFRPQTVIHSPTSERILDQLLSVSLRDKRARTERKTLRFRDGEQILERVVRKNACVPRAPLDRNRGIESEARGREPRGERGGGRGEWKRRVRERRSCLREFGGAKGAEGRADLCRPTLNSSRSPVSPRSRFLFRRTNRCPLTPVLRHRHHHRLLLLLMPPPLLFRPSPLTWRPCVSCGRPASPSAARELVYSTEHALYTGPCLLPLPLAPSYAKSTSCLLSLFLSFFLF